MATAEEYETLQAGFRVLAEALRNAAFTVSNGYVYSGPLTDVVDEVSPLRSADRSIVERAAALT